jgi:hypothetical protein
LQTSLDPFIPTLEEAIHQALTPDEADQFISYFRPLVETGKRLERGAMAYLWAVKH